MKDIPLRPVDHDVLAFLARYRIATPDTLRRILFPELKNREVRRLVSARLAPRYVRSALLYPTGDQRYYHLTRAGARAIGLPARAAGAIRNSEQLAARFGRLLFSCLSDPPRPLFTLDEFRDAFPGYCEPASLMEKRFFKEAYYLDVDDSRRRRLGRVLVVSKRSFRRVVSRALQNARQCLPRFLEEDALAFALVTGTTRVATNIERSLADLPPEGANGVLFRAEHYDALVEVLDLSKPHPSLRTSIFRQVK